MSFDEDEQKFILVPKYMNCFVYFLIKNKEVVYVGQTTQGITRPFSHKDKDFDEIRIMYCSEDELDYFEDNYINKYEPIYNKQVNYKFNHGFSTVISLIKNCTEFKNFNMRDLKKIIKTLNINVSNNYGILTIKDTEYKKIYEFIVSGQYKKDFKFLG